MQQFMIETLISGGVLSVILGGFGLALRGWLAKYFATKQDLDGLGDRVTAYANITVQTRELADENRDSIREIRAEGRAQWERMTEQVIRPLETATKSLQGMQESVAVQTNTLEAVCDWIRSQTPHALLPSPRRKKAGG